MTFKFCDVLNFHFFFLEKYDQEFVNADGSDEEEEKETIEFLGKAPKPKDSRITFHRKS